MTNAEDRLSFYRVNEMFSVERFLERYDPWHRINSSHQLPPGRYCTRSGPDDGDRIPVKQTIS